MDNSNDPSKVKQVVYPYYIEKR